MATKDFNAGDIANGKAKVTWTTIARMKKLPSMYEGKSVSVEAVMNGSPIQVNNHFIYFDARDVSRENGVQAVKVEVQRASVSGSAFEMAKTLTTNSVIRIYGKFRAPVGDYGIPVIECTGMARIDAAGKNTFEYGSALRKGRANSPYYREIIWY
ncbi:MAG: hypothetical protein KGI06_03390 [Candidatus Micrarchaeota archaeon]|nr:hypothetical protein [Candidatus Micrarchaeota archaeon]